MSTVSSRARWLAAGLALALALALGAAHALLGRARGASLRATDQRAAVIDVRALADVVSQAGGRGPGVALAVERFAAARPELAPIRVVDFTSRTLEASTAAEDQGEQAAPRRLVREEKDFYDQAQRLRAAVETNQQEGGARKEEVELLRGDDGSLTIAAPVEVEGTVVGAVIATRRAPQATPPAASRSRPLFLFLGALGLFVALALVLGDRPALAAVAAALLLALAAGLDARAALTTLRADRGTLESMVAAHLVATAGVARDALAEMAAAAAAESEEPPPAAEEPAAEEPPAEEPAAEAAAPVTLGGELDPAAWDADTSRQPFGFVTAAGTVDEARVAADFGRTRAVLVKSRAALAVAALALLLFVGLGQAARLAATLVRYRLAYAYVLPAMVAMALLVFIPFAYGITLSFTESTLYNENQSILEKWIGLDNYTDIVSDVAVLKKSEDGATSWDFENFYWTLGFTIVWTIANVGFGVTLGLALALLLNRQRLFLKPVYRVLLILPWAVPNYITALIWKGMFHQQFGVVNQILQLVGLDAVAWFDHPFTSFLAIWATNGWLSFPFMMVISLGALQSIPADLYEAAKVDGASRWQQFTAITLPSLKPALVPAVILSVIWTFNMFNIPYLTSAGEPAHATEILITGAYKIAFQKYQYGYAAAYATIIFLILLVYGIWQNKVTKATEGV